MSHETSVSRAIDDMMYNPETLDYIEITTNAGYEKALNEFEREIRRRVKTTDSCVSFKIDGRFYWDNQPTIVKHLESLGFEYMSECIYNQTWCGFCDTLDEYIDYTATGPEICFRTIDGPIYMVVYCEDADKLPKSFQ